MPTEGMTPVEPPLSRNVLPALGIGVAAAFAEGKQMASAMVSAAELVQQDALIMCMILVK